MLKKSYNNKRSVNLGSKITVQNVQRVQRRFFFCFINDNEDETKCVIVIIEEETSGKWDVIRNIV